MKRVIIEPSPTMNIINVIKEKVMTNQVTAQNLEAQREAVLEKVFTYYDFGNFIVEETSGWEHTHPGREYTRNVYLVQEDDKDKDVETILMYMTVVFKDNDSAELEDAYVIDGKGNLIGSYNERANQ